MLGVFFYEFLFVDYMIYVLKEFGRKLSSGIVLVNGFYIYSFYDVDYVIYGGRLLL